MRKPILALTLLAVAVSAGTSLRAQPALKLITVNVARAYESFWETKDYERKLQEDQTKAEGQLAEMRKQLEAAATDVRSKDEESKNTALSNDAREKAGNEARQKFEDYKGLEGQIQQFYTNTQRSLQNRMKTHRELMFDKISAIVLEIGKAQGATLIVDTSGVTGLGISSVLYADVGYDITDRVITELNKTQPADFKEN